MSFYLDASVIVPAFVRESKSDAVERLFALAKGPVIVSDLAAGEFASAISRRWRMNVVTRELAGTILGEFDDWCERMAHAHQVSSVQISLATALVRRFELKLRMPDAIHLAACQQLGLTLATLDDGLADAARALGVAHICPV